MSIDNLGTHALFQGVGDEVVYKTNNELKFENFVIQAKVNKVLLLKDETKECIITKPGMLFGTIQYNANDPSTKESVLTDTYLDLYDYLIKKNIITKEVRAGSFWTWDYVNKVNPALMDIGNLQKILIESDSEYPNTLKCYTVYYDRLSKFLQTYQYSSGDQFEGDKKPLQAKSGLQGGRKSLGKRKTRKGKTHKHKCKK